MHRIDGPGATVDNRFTDGDPVGGVQATMVTDDWANDVQEELMSILTAGGVAPVKGTQDQVLKALAVLIQGQSLTAFTTGGTAAALTLTPSPAIEAYAPDQKFRVKFSANSAGASTLNVSGVGPKSLKQYDSAGNKVAAVFAAGQLSDVEYDGTDWVLINQLPVVALSPGDIKLCAYSTPDAGFLKTSGAAVSRATYAALFAKIGTTFGVGDGATTFNLPDTRANFIRGWADNSTVDAGRVFGSYQDGTVVSMGDPSTNVAVVTNFYNGVDNVTANHMARIGADGQPSVLTGVLTGGVAMGTTEPGTITGMYTKPRNIALSYFIKF